jgi:DUF971 family protein
MAASNPSAPRPVNITLDRARHELAIEWRDGHESHFPLDGLREACPCASCRGGHENMGPEHDPDLLELRPARSYEVEHIDLVGKYALQITWDDGHNAGIYTWDYLRRICPCEACEAARNAAGSTA